MTCFLLNSVTNRYRFSRQYIFTDWKSVSWIL